MERGGRGERVCVCVRVCVEKERLEREREREERDTVQNSDVKLTASPFVSSQRPNTELAAASTEHLELRVVVMPA